MRLRGQAQQLVLHGARTGRSRGGAADDRGGGRREPARAAGRAHRKEAGAGVAAVPGRVTSPVSRGTHALLKNGAALIRGPADVLELLDRANVLPRRNGAPRETRRAPAVDDQSVTGTEARATAAGDAGTGRRRARHTRQADGRQRRRRRGAARAQRARGDGPVGTGRRRTVRAEGEPRGCCASIIGARADVAQLARASACHAEGRGFESLHPLRGCPAIVSIRVCQRPRPGR